MAFRKSASLSGVACAVLLLMGSSLQAQEMLGSADAMTLRFQALTQELSAQRELLAHLESYRQQYFEQREILKSLERQVAQQALVMSELRSIASWSTLSTQRGTGKGAVGESVQLAQVAQEKPADAKPVGQAPATDGRPPEVAPLFEQPGVLTPKGGYVLEPSVQYGYSSSNRVALVGYTIIPALLIGLIDVREVKRNTVTTALSGRFGVTNRLELEVRAPYVYRSDATVSREAGIPGATEGVFSASGMHMGDLELGARYQLNEGGVDRPFYVGSLRFKTRTGTDPFDVVTDCKQRCIDTASGSGLPLDLPSGSGFYSLQAGLTVLYPSDPAVFFGSLTYLHNFSRNGISRKVLNGEYEYLGTISPGGVLGFNFGMGLALNEKSTFSIGYDHNSVGRTERDGLVVPGSVRTQLGTLVLGYSYRLTQQTSLNVSVGAGLTRDTPDVSLTLRLPMSF